MNPFEFEFKDNSIEELERFTKEVLDKIDGKSGTRRKKMYQRGNMTNEPKGSYSITFGYTSMSYLSKTKSRMPSDISGLYYTKLRGEHPELKGILQQLVDLHSPTQITVDQVQINRNWRSPPHRDSGNVGESSIIGMGDYVGGQTIVEYSPDHIHEYDIKNKFVRFDGSRYTHYTMPFSGDRYSLVFYNHKKLR